MVTKVKVLRAYPGGDREYEEMFDSHPSYEVTQDLDEADLVCFTGGTDINSDFYNEDPHYAADLPDYGRDDYEAWVFNEMRVLGKPMVGICRGSQLLYALNGGKLNQDIGGHLGSHAATVTDPLTGDQEVMVVSSSHHQQMRYDPLLDVNILGYGEELREIEVAYFPRTKCLCHQPHPEWMDSEAPYREYFFKTLSLILDIYN